MEGIGKDSTSGKSLGLSRPNSLHFAEDVHRGDRMELVLHSPVITLKEDHDLAKSQNIIVRPFIQYISIMDSLEPIPIANVPTQGPTNSLFIVPKRILREPSMYF